MPRLILGAGKHTVKKPGDIFCDIREFDGIDVVHDLNVLPWPFRDNCVTHISCIHVVEHLDSLIDFMNECHRILLPGCSVYIETPLAGGDPDLEHADPTHKRCFRPYSFFNYFSPEGIEQFGYTDKAWCLLKQEVKDSVIIVHASTIK